MLLKALTPLHAYTSDPLSDKAAQLAAHPGLECEFLLLQAEAMGILHKVRISADFRHAVSSVLLQELSDAETRTKLAPATATQLMEMLPVHSTVDHLATDALQSAFQALTRAVQPTAISIEPIPNPDGLPAGWTKVESRSRKGEFSYFNAAKGQRQAQVPREPVPGFADPVRVTLPLAAPAEQVKAHLAFSLFCDRQLRDTEGAIDKSALATTFLRSHMAAMRYVHRIVCRHTFIFV